MLEAATLLATIIFVLMTFAIVIGMGGIILLLLHLVNKHKNKEKKDNE